MCEIYDTNLERRTCRDCKPFKGSYWADNDTPNRDKVEREVLERWASSRAWQSKRLAATRTRLLWQARRSLEKIKWNRKPFKVEIRPISDKYYKKDGEIFDELITPHVTLPYTDDPSFKIDLQLGSFYVPSNQLPQPELSTNCSDIQLPFDRQNSIGATYSTSYPSTSNPSTANLSTYQPTIHQPTIYQPANPTNTHAYGTLAASTPTTSALAPNALAPNALPSINLPSNTTYPAQASSESYTSLYQQNLSAIPLQQSPAPVHPLFRNSTLAIHSFSSSLPLPQSELPYSAPEKYSNCNYQPPCAKPLAASADSLESNSSSFQLQTHSKPKSRSYPTSPNHPITASTSTSKAPCISTYQKTSSISRSTSSSSISSSPSSSNPTTTHSHSPIHHPKSSTRSPRRNDHSGDFRKLFLQLLENDAEALEEWTKFMQTHGCPKPRVCVRTHLAFCDLRTQKNGEKDSFAVLRLNPKWRRLGSRTFCECMSFGPCYVGNTS